MKILTLEQILKEDINSFIEWGTEAIQKKISTIHPDLNAGSKQFQYLLRNIYILSEGYSEINAKETLMIYLNGTRISYMNDISEMKYFLKIIKIYKNLINLEPKQYGIKLKKISKNHEFEKVDDIIKYIEETANKIKDIMKNKDVKKKNKDNRMADEFLYEDDNVKISLFTKFNTAEKTFGGISNWCITKNLNYWNQYTKVGVLVLFNNKKVKYKSREETPEAFVCNHYSIKGSYFSQTLSYDMKDNKISHHLTDDYEDIVKEKCTKLFGGNLSDWKNIVETNITEEGFFSIPSYNFINDKVVAKNMVFVGRPRHHFDIGSDEYRQEDYDKFINAEYYGGLQISPADFSKINFPNIKYISFSFELYGFVGNVTVDKNDLDVIDIRYKNTDNAKTKNIEFKDDLILKKFNVLGGINSFSIKCKNEMSIEKLMIDDLLFGFDSVADTEFSYDNETNGYKIESLSGEGELEINNMRKHSQHININNYDMVHFYIDNFRSIDISKYIFEDVEEVHFYTSDDDIDKIMKHIEEKKDPSLDDVEIFYHED